jgi:uncharacterized repeat protein (TIGR01451 family)
VDPVNSTLTAVPPTVVADGATPSVITLQLLDRSGQPLAGRTVEFTTSRGGDDVLSQTTVVTDANGRAVVDLTSVVPGQTEVRVRDLSSGVTLLSTATVTFTQGLVVQLSKTAGPTRAQPGQVVRFTIELRNTGGLPLADVRVQDRPDAGLSFVEDSARLDGEPLAGAIQDGASLLFPVGLLPAPVDQNGNGQLDAGEPGYRVITYAMRVGATASPGIYGNRAQAVDSCDDCLVSDPARAELEVRADPAFDLGTIIGKVYFDRDGNGVQDRGEPGLSAAMVALDDGTYALTDEFGRYHFPAVHPGQRLVKVNLASVAGNARAVDREARVLSVTPGLLVKANFGLQFGAEREAIGRAALYGAELQAESRLVADDVRGSTRMFTVVVNGREAMLTTREVRLVTQRMDAVVFLDDTGPLALQFAIDPPSNPQPPVRWRFFVRDGGSTVVREWQGEGTPPRSIGWDGTDAAGRRIPSGEVYFYQLEVDYTGGLRVASALRYFGMNRRSSVLLDLNGGAFVSGSAVLTDAARQLLSETAVVIRQYPEEKVVIAGHTDSVGGGAYNQTLSEHRARAAFDYLTAEEQLPPGRFIVVGYGESQPVASNDTPEGRERNRRVELLGDLAAVERARLDRRTPGEAWVALNGRAVEVNDDGRFEASAQATDPVLGSAERFDIEMTAEDGRAVAASLQMPRIRLLADYVGERLAFPGEAAHDGAAARAYAGRFDYVLRGQTDAGGDIRLDGEPLAVDGEGRFEAPLQLSPGDNRYVLSATNPAGFVRYANLNVRMRVERDGKAVVAVPPIPALSVDLPGRDGLVTVGKLVVPGTTAAGNKVMVNGQEVPVAEDGSFLAVVPLENGENHFRAEVVDPDGNSGAIERSLHAGPGKGLFMLALADGKVTQLQRGGRGGSSEVVTEGRLAFYLKGQVLGRYLLTAAFDSGTAKFSKLFSDLNARDNDRLLTNLDPDTVYPVYGDTSELVYDAESQGKLYLALTGEQVEALIGNFALSFTDTELAAYQRTLHGAQLKYHSAGTTSEGAPRTEAQLIAADTQSQSIRDEISATGGSLYFLSHQDVVEGSEQISILVRDQNTGLLLQRLPQQRGVDYTIQYEQGRVYFNRPLPSVQADSSLIGPAPLAGNPVSVQVDYSTQDSGGGSSTFAGRVRQRLLDGKVAVGATAVSDDQGTSQYELGGVDVEYRTGGTRVVTEFARSQGTESSVFSSSDGGLSYASRAVGPALEADAFRVAGEFDVGEWFGHGGRYLATAYYKSLAAGFAANQNFAPDDTEQLGGSLSWLIGARDRLNMRFDSMSVGADRRTLTAAQWRHDAEKYSLVAELQDRSTDGPAATMGSDVTQAAVRASTTPLDGVTLSLTHMETLRGDEGRETGLEAQWKINSHFGLRGRAAFGDRGDAVELGALYEVPAGQFYLGRKMRSSELSESSATVLGATLPIEGGKAYTEYEWGQTDGGRSARTMAGVQRDWRHASGLSVLLSAERSTADTALAGDERWAVAAGLAYDNGAGLRLSSRNEWRRQQGASDLDQFVSVNAADWTFRDDLTLLGRLRIGDTRDHLQPLQSLTFNEATLGMAFRPVHHDRFAALLRFTRRDESPTAAQVTSDRLPSVSNVLSADWSYQITPRLEWVGKQAIRQRSTDYGEMQLDSQTMLSIQRLNVKLFSDFALGLEARRLSADESDDAASGWLTELSWERFRHMRIGIGYNFTDFSDDLVNEPDYSERGVFLRLQGVY